MEQVWTLHQLPAEKKKPEWPFAAFRAKCGTHLLAMLSLSNTFVLTDSFIKQANLILVALSILEEHSCAPAEVNREIAIDLFGKRIKCYSFIT